MTQTHKQMKWNIKFMFKHNLDFNVGLCYCLHGGYGFFFCCQLLNSVFSWKWPLPVLSTFNVLVFCFLRSYIAFLHDLFFLSLLFSVFYLFTNFIFADFLIKRFNDESEKKTSNKLRLVLSRCTMRCSRTFILNIVVVSKKINTTTTTRTNSPMSE